MNLKSDEIITSPRIDNTVDITQNISSLESFRNMSSYTSKKQKFSEFEENEQADFSMEMIEELKEE